jgi:hypothetical protein
MVRPKKPRKPKNTTEAVFHNLPIIAMNKKEMNVFMKIDLIEYGDDDDDGAA